MSKFKVGDRVTRRVYLDDGTWECCGDSCLSDSPLYRGVVVKLSTRLDDDDEDDEDHEAKVRLDGSTRERWFLEGGLEAEKDSVETSIRRLRNLAIKLADDLEADLRKLQE